MVLWRTMVVSSVGCALFGLWAWAAGFAQDETHTIFVTSNGWHTGIVISRNDLPDGAIPETADFPRAKFFEFGWGDADFYPDREAGLAKGLGAIMSSSPAVVHLVNLWGPPDQVFQEAEVVQLSIGADALAALIDFLNDSFDRGGADRVAASAPGLYSSSGFYPATGEFHYGNTCNHWTARGLAAAGFDIDPSGMRRASALMRAVRKLAKEQAKSAE